MSNICNKCGRNLNTNLNNNQYMKEREVNERRTNFLKKENFPIVKIKPVGKIEPRADEKKNQLILPRGNNVEIFNSGFKPPVNKNISYNNENISFAAILTKVDEDIQINSENKIFFTIGMSNSKNIYFNVLDNGSAFQFNTSGLFRIVFSGTINVPGILSFERKPLFNSNQEFFTKYNINKSDFNQSTMLPFKKGFILSIKFYPNNKSQNVILKAGSQLEIYKVDNL